MPGSTWRWPKERCSDCSGPNGAGKTTAIRILATVLRPDGGPGRGPGPRRREEADAVRRRIGLAGQYAAVDANLTGRENLQMVGVFAQLPRARSSSRRASCSGGSTSPTPRTVPCARTPGGMRRRLDIAASLVPEPPVLFLDEPTTGLDITSRNELWDMIRELVGDGTTVLLTTQYLEEADQTGGPDRRRRRRQVIANDTPRTLKSQLGTPSSRWTSRRRRASARSGCWPVVTGNGRARGRALRVTSDQGAHVAGRGPAVARSRRPRARTLRCASRASTTCSSP